MSHFTEYYRNSNMKVNKNNYSWICIFAVARFTEKLIASFHLLLYLYLFVFTFDLRLSHLSLIVKPHFKSWTFVASTTKIHMYVSQAVVCCYTCGDHNPTVVCAYMRTIIAHGERVRQVESMTSCQSWNGNLAAKRGTSQLPATANNLGRSRSSAIHERVSIYAATIIENRRSRSTRSLFQGRKHRAPARFSPIVISYTGEAINFDYQNNLRIISQRHRNGVIILWRNHVRELSSLSFFSF